MMAQKSKAVTGLTSGIEGLFKKNKVVYVKGAAKLTGPNTVMASLLEGGEQQITADKIIIATGSVCTHSLKHTRA
jgi:dihydrolipoamide dehydrogenase